MNCTVIASLLSTLSTLLVTAADWPMWRFDSHRSAASPEKLPAELHLQWTRQYAPRVQVWDDPLNHDLMPYDKVFEPVVLGDRMFVGFNDTDKVVALDIRTGQELWTFYTDGPVRLPPVAWQNQVYFTSDDGCLYCVDAEAGRLKWKFRGGPSERKVLGNGRMISAWPARGGPVLRDGQVYFAASIWPFMGTFIYALDAESGKVAWLNDDTGSQYIRQPHSAPAFAGVAPQGGLVATDRLLLVPGGRSVPAAFDRKTGELRYFHIADGGKGNGGSFVVADESEFYVHTRLRGVRAYDLKTGKAGRFTVNEPVLDGNRLYTASENARGKVLQAYGEQVVWELPVDASGDLIKAGPRLYAAGTDTLSAVDLPTGDEQPHVTWSHPVRREVLRLLAAGGRLFAVTLDGRILAFGSENTEPITIRSENVGQASSLPVDGPSLPSGSSVRRPPESLAAQAKSILKQADTDEGYALWFGVEEDQLLGALALESKFRIIAVDPNEEKVHRLRRRLDAAGLYGTRVTVHVGDPVSFKAPPYIANLIVVGESLVAELRNRPVLQAVYDSVRPYGGVLRLPVADSAQPELARLIQDSKLERAKVKSSPGHLLVIREGALPDAADWTHQYGDVANTVKSDDARVKAPLGLLWFGGASNRDVLPRHSHGPPEQVVGGRLLIQGLNSISARDVYTGRMLWNTEFEDLGTFGIYYNETYTNTPLSIASNQRHFPGANARGANFVATEDEVYVVEGSSCQVLEARTGLRRRTIALPPKSGQSERPQWGYIGITDNILLAGDGFAHYSQKFSVAGKPSTNSIEDFSASDGLAAFDRYSGKLLWRGEARHRFIHNGIVAGNGRVYCLDKLPKSAEDKLKRRGADAPSDYRIAAFEAQTGQLLWETEGNIFGTWLGYSRRNDVLLLAGASASDRLRDEAGQGMTGYRGRDGAVLWQDLQRKYTGPCILHNDLILTSANSYQASSGAFKLLDGSPHLVRNPLTGKLEPWRISRTYGCNSIVASENLLTFRSGAAGFYDLLTKSGTGNLGGFRSGCTANLVVANGVLNAPDYTRTCSCSYQNQTSLAFVHMPDMELWTCSQFGLDAEEGDRITRVGINFGAPGDRRAEDGTLWLEYPTVGGESASLKITVTGDQTGYFRSHISQVEGPGLGWVIASGVRDCEAITVIPEILRPGLNRPPSPRTATNSAPAATADDQSAKPALQRQVHPPAPYTVRLHFAEPEERQLGQRVFDVSLQDQLVLERFDVAKAAGGSLRGVVKEINGVIIQKELKVAFNRAPGSQAGPVLCGLELIAEQPAAGE
ncbi:MAG: PQQ-binding-like beta-propeller repeat protein [Verrucomicrobia bacterium]|nr:PQQ-binding-like beta-propeller repeat protein [Verrucomicrobiota bacterium]